jgi:hypothetical protein
MFGCYSFIFGRSSLYLGGTGGSIPPILSHVVVPLALSLRVGVLYDQRKTQPVR